ncbi:unnamed protein product [Linum trigynum]|uniref:Uncharacterized protein n=1 Tax=Linum trigynum TaxID=586398 RepID=A0AAV2GQ04_9ROSI
MDEPNQEPHRYEARKLDFNLPLLSTRRHGRRCDDDEVEQLSCSTAANSINLPHRVPFCWERAPGRPVNDAGDDQDDWTPRLRLPPCRWHPTQTDDVVQDEGCDADVDEDGYEGDYYNNNNNSNSYSNVDALSLTEAIDIAQRGDGEFGRRERFSVSSSRNGNDGAGGGGGGSPNFMMERFLPDATALAASSVLYSTNKMLPFYAPDSDSPASVVSDKGCGLDALLPWRTKHKLCNAKSPVRQAPLSAKQKRDHRSAGK